MTALYPYPGGNTSKALRIPLLLPLLCLCVQLQTRAQEQTQQRKISPLLAGILSNTRAGDKMLIRVAIKGGVFPDEMEKSPYALRKIRTGAGLSFATITCTRDELLQRVLPSREVVFAEPALRVPREELLLNRLDLGVNKINLAHRWFPQWNGEGAIVSVKENRPDTADIDLAGRFLSTSLASPNLSAHASIMCTMIGGGGNSWYTAKGAAWGSTVSSSDFSTLLPDADADYRKYGITVQNNSYGVGIENYYGADAAAWDASAINNPHLLHVFSAGNSGADAAGTGAYAGLNGFANLTGSFKMAKNILTVGATDSFSNVVALSSRGPAYDGRVKPELVAFGEDGSSGAAALVSGASLMLQQAYRQRYSAFPATALIKAVLLNSADDLGNPEVDYTSGFGALNAYKALQTLDAGQFFRGSIGNGSTMIFPLTVPAGIRKIKLTLVWNDPPASPNAAKALVNDLDLELFNPASGQSWKPWVLNPFPRADSLRLPAVRKRDSLNNAEQVTLNDPVTGNYEIRVSGFAVTGTAQEFFVAYQFDTANVFEWQYPTTADPVFSGADNVLRWRSTFAGPTGRLEFSADKGATWQTISSRVDPGAGYYKWTAPSIVSNALLRMTVGNSQFSSDTFTLSRRIPVYTGFNCPDSLLLYWNSLPGAAAYRLYRLGSKYLEPVQLTADSFALLSKGDKASPYYAVAPLVENREGLKSYTINYTAQGVGCYIRSFLGVLVNTSSSLTLALGTTYGIGAVVLEKFNGSGYLPIQQSGVPASLTLPFTDTRLTRGLNTYRVKLQLQGGKVIYSDPVSVYYFSGADIIVYPNPASRWQPIHILTADPLQYSRLQIWNTLGQMVYSMPVDDVLAEIPAGKLGTGLYLFRFLKEGKTGIVMKVIVQ